MLPPTQQSCRITCFSPLTSHFSDSPSPHGSVCVFSTPEKPPLWIICIIFLVCLLNSTTLTIFWTVRKIYTTLQDLIWYFCLLSYALVSWILPDIFLTVPFLFCFILSSFIPSFSSLMLRSSLKQHLLISPFVRAAFHCAWRPLPSCLVKSRVPVMCCILIS